jgi:hypothetical protein
VGRYSALAGNGGTRVIDVGKYHAWAAENIVFQGDGIIDADVVLHLDVVADDDVVANEDVLAEGAALPIRAPPEMCTQCQTRVLSPIWAPSSTIAVGWAV